MKSKILITLVLLSSCINAKGQDTSLPRITFGAEWGYIATFYSGYHHNFFAPEGYRVDSRGHSFALDNNAEGYLHIGYNIDQKRNLSLYAGMSAVMDYHLTIPVSVRFSRYYGNNHMADRWFTFFDIGSGVSIKKDPQEIITGKFGGGYRMSLSRNTKLDFLIAYRCVYTHPDIEYYESMISHERINRNNAYTSAISFGIALSF